MKKATTKKATAKVESCNGLEFVVTGKVYKYTNRDALSAYISSQGGKVNSSVTAKTNFLINNDVESTSSKNKKAKALGIPIISEDEFIKRFTTGEQAVEKANVVNEVRVELWSYNLSLGYTDIPSVKVLKDKKVFREYKERARYSCYECGFDVSDEHEVIASIEINGERISEGYRKVKFTYRGEINSWAKYMDKVGIYSVDIDKASYVAYFKINGEFDPSKLEIIYRTAITPACYKNDIKGRESKLLGCIRYDGNKPLDKGDDEEDEVDNKGCFYAVFNKGKVATADDLTKWVDM